MCKYFPAVRLSTRTVENKVREVPISLYRVTVLTGKVPCKLLLMKS